MEFIITFEQNNGLRPARQKATRTRLLARISWKCEVYCLQNVGLAKLMFILQPTAFKTLDWVFFNQPGTFRRIQYAILNVKNW